MVSVFEGHASATGSLPRKFADPGEPCFQTAPCLADSWGHGTDPLCLLFCLSIWSNNWAHRSLPGTWADTWLNLPTCMAVFFLTVTNMPQLVIRHFISVFGVWQRKSNIVSLWQELKTPIFTSPAKSSCPSPARLHQEEASQQQQPPLSPGSFLGHVLSSPPSLLLCRLHQGLVFLQEFLGCAVCSLLLSHSAITFPFRLLPYWWFGCLVQYFTFISIGFQLPPVTRGT